ncbi:MAG: CHRD domain-containing protein [Planctomycetota bacterium]
MNTIRRLCARPLVRTASATLAVAGLVAPALATVHTFQVTLNTVEETPTPAGSTGLGTATVTLDDVANTVSVNGSYTGLSSNATLAHVHGSATIGVAAGVAEGLAVSGGTSGTISRGGSVTPAQVADMLAGLTYINVHTVNNPSGEIRGQILAEPLGTTAFCFGDGSLSSACPCAAPDTVPSPAGATAHGCANSFDVNGALLKVTGTTAPDTVRFIADVGIGYSAFGMLLMSATTDANGVASGDGLMCLTNLVVQFGAHNAGSNGDPLGMWTYPNAVQTTSVSAATSQPAASTASYQFLYRNASGGFCNPSTFNVSNGLQVPWP